uniref:Amino acid transporter transmembrane domain-containing protein n=1 Tax=Moniliophthora roreri TaxID=221103 RepID=A0A0W0FFB4_MONRR
MSSSSQEKHEKVPIEDEASPGSILSTTPESEPTLREYIRLAALCRSREKEGDTVVPENAVPGILERSGVDKEELLAAQRALRTATWISVFYLITTDILGPFNAPFAFSQVGYVPGTILYVVMGAVACYTGLILSHLFCKLDSVQYPVRTYADLGGRILGNWFKHLCTALQSLQLIVNVGTICLSNGQAVEQLAANHKICFSIAIVIWAFVGMIIGQIRTLKNYGWLANSAVWLNLLIIFTSMGFVAHSPPNFASAQASFGVEPGPVMTSAFVSLPLFAKVNGIMNMVFAYGGAMIFPEFMAEMRRPMDFWKGMVCAQLLISTVYLLYGIFVYSFQGQFTLGLAFQGVSKQSWQDVGNVLALITGIIAAGLYGNIGITYCIEVAYYQIVEGWLKGPPFMSRRGKMLWPIVVVLYWSLAFIVGSAIPQVQTISGLIAAICIMQFTYTFPPLLLLGYQIRVFAEGYGDHVATRNPNEPRDDDPGDTWRNLSRWKRGLFGGGNGYFNLFNLILFLGSASMACLGMYGSGTSIRETFKHGAATSFGCKSPV